jgi:hypothetical protein
MFLKCLFYLNYIPASCCSITYDKTMFFILSAYNTCIIETCLLSLHVSARSSHHQVPEFLISYYLHIIKSKIYVLKAI